MNRLLLSLACLLAAILPLEAQEKKPTYYRGHKEPTPAERQRRHEEARKRHGHIKFAKADAATFDCVALGWCAKTTGDQGQCGSCWLHSSTRVLTSAYMKAGYGADWAFSPQYFMDCKAQDPCDGGDEYDVFTWAKSDGAVTETDYGVPYAAQQLKCKYTSQKKYLIADFGYTDPSSNGGQSTVQGVKNAMTQYGEISVALDAGDFNSYTGGVMTITGKSIDHAVSWIGWDDGKKVFRAKKTPMELPVHTSTGALHGRNQWGTGWGEGGDFWASYDSYFVECIWVSVAALPPPPQPVPPGPTPPGPTPPGPVPPAPSNNTIVLGPQFGAAAGTYTLIPQGGFIVTADMTVGELSKHCCGQQLATPPVKVEAKQATITDAAVLQRILTLLERQDARIGALEKQMGSPKVVNGSK